MGIESTMVRRKMELETMRKNHHMGAVVVAVAAPS
jgi:hypothetical protein